MPEPNFANRTVWTGDNLNILRGLNGETVDLIYLDPPFNSNRDYAELVIQRLDSPEYGALFRRAWVTVRDDIPQRTDIDAPINYRQRKHELFGRQEGRCNGCRHDFPFRNFTVDHIVARSRGGTDHFDNLQLLCAACNSLKGNRSQEYLMAQLGQRVA